MKYYEIKFTIDAPADVMQDARDILTALSAEAGLETFEDTEEGVTGYAQQALFQQDVLDGMLASFPMENVHIMYIVKEAENRDWNEQWEQEGFEPIVIGHQCVVHDGRHLGNLMTANFPIAIEIDAHLAFGTGTHETTQMMVASLLEHDLRGKRVLDCGCGTGILSIAALKGGAQEAIGYDIDEWSTDNARHNAVINQVDNRFTSLLGDVSILNSVEGEFDFILANINRNILLADMPSFVQHLKEGGILLLSGFYKADVPILNNKATTTGLTPTAEHATGEWACLKYRRC